MDIVGALDQWKGGKGTAEYVLTLEVDRSGDLFTSVAVDKGDLVRSAELDADFCVLKVAFEAEFNGELFAHIDCVRGNTTAVDDSQLGKTYPSVAATIRPSRQLLYC
jgi:hypothetical protein